MSPVNFWTFYQDCMTLWLAIEKLRCVKNKLDLAVWLVCWWAGGHWQRHWPIDWHWWRSTIVCWGQQLRPLYVCIRQSRLLYTAYTDGLPSVTLTVHWEFYISEQWQYFASDSEEDDGHWLFSFLANFCHLIDCCVVRLNKTFTHQRCLACWCSGYSIGLLTWRLLAWLPPVPLSGINLRQVVHVNVPMSPIRINWYQSKGSDALRLGR